MEATVGDITRPLQIRRFDWTPGELFESNAPVDKITLRYFPSDIVADTGAKQSQNYIVQGVFLTTETNQVPVRAGEIVTSLPEEAAAAKPGNYLDNGSFEAGLFPWGKSFGISAVYGAGNLDDTTAAHGKYSFKFPAAAENIALESPLNRVAAGPATLSFYARADQPVALTVRLAGLTEDLKNYRSAGLDKTFTLTNQWQRYSISGTIPALPGALYTVRFSGKKPANAAVWLDAIQLQSGPLTDFQPPAGGEVGYACDVPGNIFYQGQKAEIDLLVFRPAGAKQPATVAYRVVDYWGREVDRGAHANPLTGNNARVRVPIFAAKTGLFRATFTLGTSTSEMVYSVLPPNAHLNEKYPQGSLGTDAVMEEAQLAILKRANFNWVLTKTLGRWNNVEREDGQYTFNDAAIAAADRAHISTVVQILAVQSDLPKWLRAFDKPPGGAPWEAARQDQYVRRWSALIDQLAQHYKTSVHHWEIENEPNCFFSPAEYARLLKSATQAIRRADPVATIAAISGGGFPPDYYRDAIAAAGADSFDALSVHFYGNQPDRMRAFADLCQAHKKPGWNTETGGTCPTFFTRLANFESLRQKEYWKTVESDTRSLTTHTVQNYLLSRSVGHMDRYFYYFARFVNAGPSQPTAWFGSGKELVEFDDGLRANAVGLSIASHFFDTATYAGPIDRDPKLEMHVFDRANRTVGFCWAKPGQRVSLETQAIPNATFYDVMGNRLEGATIEVTDSPIYFESAQNPPHSP